MIFWWFHHTHLFTIQVSQTSCSSQGVFPELWGHTFIWTLEHHFYLGLFCSVDTFCSCTLWLFLIVAPAKSGPLEYVLLSCAQACHIDTHLCWHSSVGFVFSGLRVFTFLPKLCCGPNPCSSTDPTCSTQTQGKSQLTVKIKEREADWVFSELGPWRWELRKTDSIHSLV